MPVDFSVKKRIEKQYKANLKGLFKYLYQFVIDGDYESVISSKAFNAFTNSIASRMITGLAFENAKDWRSAAREGMQGRVIYEALKEEMKGPVGYRVQSLIDDNARLIKSVSGTMANTIANQIKENAQSGVRASAYAKRLKEWNEKEFGELTEARINLIARTETSKASTALTRARAENLGLNWYIWRTSEDFRVRSSHKHMDGVLINWNDPPSPEQLINIKSSLGSYHAGNAPNCRCYPEPIVNLNLVKFPAKVYTGGRIVTMTRVEFERLAA